MFTTQITFSECEIQYESRTNKEYQNNQKRDELHFCESVRSSGIDKRDLHYYDYSCFAVINPFMKEMPYTMWVSGRTMLNPIAITILRDRIRVYKAVMRSDSP